MLVLCIIVLTTGLGCGASEESTGGEQCDEAAAHLQACTGVAEPSYSQACRERPSGAEEILRLDCDALQLAVDEAKADGGWGYLAKGRSCAWDLQCREGLICRPVTTVVGANPAEQCQDLGGDEAPCLDDDDCAGNQCLGAGQVLHRSASGSIEDVTAGRCAAASAPARGPSYTPGGEIFGTLRTAYRESLTDQVVVLLDDTGSVRHSTITDRDGYYSMTLRKGEVGELRLVLPAFDGASLKVFATNNSNDYILVLRKAGDEWVLERP